MKDKLILFPALAFMSIAVAVASDTQLVIEYDDEDSPLIVPLDPSVPFVIGADGGLSARAAEGFDLPTQSEPPQIQLEGFTVDNVSSISIEQGSQVDFRWQSRGAWSCEGSGLPGTAWDESDKLPNSAVLDNGRQRLTVDVDPGVYTPSLTCFNAGFPSNSLEVELEVTEGFTVPEGCESRTLRGSNWERGSHCVSDSSKDCFFYAPPFGEFPGTGNTQTFRQYSGEYTAMQFTTPSNLSPSATGGWSIEAPSASSGITNTGHKIWTISTCPGDFNKSVIEADPDLGPGCYFHTRQGSFPSASRAIRWGGEDFAEDASRCGLKPGNTSCLNVV